MKRSKPRARRGNEQKCVEEPESGRGPVLLDSDGSTVDRMIEESEEYQEF